MRILLVANDHVGSAMAGPGIRYAHLAEELARRHEVTLTVPNEDAVEPPGVRVVAGVDPRDHERVAPLAAAADAVVTQQLSARTLLWLARRPVRKVYDLYVPLLTENLAWTHATGLADDRLAYRAAVDLQELALLTANAVVCASDAQRDLWLGVAAARGRLGELAHAIEVVPFGLAAEPPAPGPPALRGAVSGIGAEDTVVLWAGGIWNWLDPETPIRAVAALARDDVRLVFLGGRPPNPGVPEMEAAARARALAAELGVLDRAVFFLDGWVPYAERARYLLEADVGISCHADPVEARFSFRTRLLDHLWAGLPTVATEGDPLAELVRAEGVGRTVPVCDVAAWTRALAELLDDAAARAAAREAAARVRPRFEWSRVAEPLLQLVEAPGAPVPVGGAALAAARRHLAARARLSVRRRGVGGSLRRLVTR
ncbi:MAG TPA: glycosyltransferase [Gaiellaceae bacterium]|nr:glycosyltransferase [Gaiellaceae bacterium]